MRKLFGISIVLCVLLAAGAAFAQDNTLNLDDLKGLSDSARNEIVKKKLKAMENTANQITSMDPEKAEKWANIISGTIKTICKDLAIEVNEFVKTPVGKVTIGLIVYKVIGEDIKRIVFAVIGWPISMAIILLLMRKFLMRERIEVKDSEGNLTDVRYVPRYEWESNDARTIAALVFVASMAAVTLAAILMVSA